MFGSNVERRPLEAHVPVYQLVVEVLEAYLEDLCLDIQVDRLGLALPETA